MEICTSKSPIQTKIKSASSLQYEDLLNLFDGKIIALQIKNYYSSEIARTISQWLLQKSNLERYLRAPDIGFKRMGMTFFETNGSPENLVRYYQEALPMIQGLRKICSPYLSPLDQLRLDLSDLWLPGAAIENVHNRRMLAGIARAVEGDFELPPHQDILLRDIEDTTISSIPSYENLTMQFSSNIYLSCPQHGGELEIWNCNPSRTNQSQIRDDNYQYEGIIDREQIPASSIKISPEVGELIIFRSDYIHGVRASTRGARVSMSVFLGYRGRNKPLTYWS